LSCFDQRNIASGSQGRLKRIVVIEFPTVEQANEWWNFEIYSKAKIIRQRTATTKMIIVEGV